MQVSVQLGENNKDVMALYFRLTRHKVAKTVESSDSVNIDLDSRGNVIGVEVLNPESVSALVDIADLYHAPELKKIVKSKWLQKAFA